MFSERTKAGIALAGLSCLSLFLISMVDRWFYEFLKSFGSWYSLIADLRITSGALILGIYYFLGRYFSTEFIRSGSKDRERAYLLAAIWIFGTLYFVLVKKVWVPRLTSWVDYVAFMVTGLMAEEFLFRGALYDLSAIIFGTQRFFKFSIPIWFTSILFGIQHLGYHHFQINSASLAQVAYTAIMGLFLGNLKEATGSIWPVILLHLVTNSFTVLRNLGFF